MPITINPSPTPKKPLTTAEKLARLRASRNGGGGSSSVPKSSIPKAPLSGKTINNTLPESPTRKFWEEDSFKQYVHKIKEIRPATTATMPDRAMKNVDMEAEASASAIRGKMSLINSMADKYPRDDVGHVPRLDPDIPVGSRLYFDTDRGEITSRETDLPFFLDQNRNLTLDPTQASNAANPAVFNSTIAKGMLEDYSTFLTTYADVVNTPPVEYKRMSVKSLEQSMASGKVSEAMINSPVYVDKTVGGEAEPQVVSVAKEQPGALRAWAETGNSARDVVARIIMVGKGTSWLPEVTKEIELSRMGMMGADKQTAQMIQAAGIPIQKSDPLLTKAAAFAGNTAAYAIGFIMKSLRALLPEVGMKERLQGQQFKNLLMNAPEGSTAKEALSGYDDVLYAINAQVEEAKEQPDQFAFQSLQEAWDYLTAYTKTTGEIIATTPEAQKNLLLSDYNKKLAVVDIGNAVITDYDFTNPEQLGNAITKLVEAHDLESTIGARDINATWTGMGDPARDKQFKYMLAQFEINKYVTTGELWATKEEREQLKSYVADPSIEFAGQMLFDWNNLLNIPSSTVFSDDFLRNYARATGVRNVNELQLDGLMFTTAARYAGKGVNFLGAGAMEGVNAVKGGLEGLGILKPIDNQMLDLAQRNLYFSSKAKISNRTLASKIFNNTTDLFNNYAGSATSIIKEVPETMFSEITNMGLDIAAIKAEGITDINEIVRRIQASDKYSPLISSDKRIIDINRMVDLQNPLGKGKGQGAWKLENTFGEARTAKAEEYKSFFDKKIHDGTIDLNDFTKDTGIPEVNDILRQAIDIEPDKQMSFIGKELSNLANKFGNERLTMDEVAQTIGAKFSRKFKDEHSVFSAGKTNFMDDQLRGIVDKWLTKKGSKLVDGKVVRDATKRGWLVLRDVFRIGHVTKDFIMEQWIGNIITKKTAYWAVQQPLEQGATHLFSGSGSLVRRAVDYVTSTPKLLNALEEFPVPSEATRGFLASMDISKDIDAVKYRDRLVKFYRDNPDAWKPTPGTFSLYFSKSLRDSYDTWVKDALATKGVDDLVEQEKLLAQASKDKRLIGNIPTPNGKITTILGKPFSLKERAGGVWKAILETGGDIASSNELMTKAGIAVEHFQTTRQFMNDPQFDILSAQARGILADAGYAPEAIDTAIGNIKRLWNNSHGNASRFVNDLKIKATGKVDVAVGQIPPELQSLSMGMDATEKRTWLEQTNDSLNKYVTGLKQKGEDLTPESADVFFKETLDVYKQEAEQVSNIAGGVAGHNIFGESLVKRPISADTQKLLDDIDANGIENSKYVTKGTVPSAIKEEYFIQYENGVHGDNIFIDKSEAVDVLNGLKAKFPEVTLGSRVSEKSVKQLLKNTELTEQFGFHQIGFQNFELPKETKFDIFKSGKIIPDDTGMVFMRPANQYDNMKDMVESENTVILKIPDNTNLLKVKNREELADILGFPSGEYIHNLDVPEIGLEVASRLKAKGYDGVWNVESIEIALIAPKDGLDIVGQTVGDFPDVLYKTTATPNEPQYTPQLKKILIEDNGIDIGGKTVQQAIDELNESVRPVSWKSPEVHEANAIAAFNESIPRLSTYKPRVDGEYISKYWDTEGRVASADELLKNPRQIPGEPNIRGMRRDETIARRLEKNPDDPMAEPLEYYKRANGEVRGIVRNLNDKFIASGKTDTAAYDLYNNLNTQIDNENMFQRILWNDTDGILTTGYPGFKATGEGAHELYKEANLIKGISLSKRGKYFDELKTSVIENKPDFKQWTVGDPFKAEGIDIVPDVDGFTPLEFTLQRHNGLGVQRFGKGTPFYDMMVNNTDAGIKNMEVWNAPLSSSVSELREKALLSQPPRAALLPIEQIPEARIGFMEAFLQKPAFEGDNLWKYIEPFMEGKKLGAIDADDVYASLIKASKINTGNVAKDLENLAEWIKEVDHYAVHGVLLKDETVAIPFTSDTVSDKIRAATKIKLTSAAQLKGIENAFKLWKESLLKQSADGSLFLKQFDVANGDALNEAARVFAKGAVEFEDKLWHGGEIDGIRMEGAVPYAKQRMRVGNESVYDQFAKGIVPFWNFSTRGAATWARFVIEHPQLFRLYQKYLKLGRGQALTTGLTKSNGQPLPSTLGKIRLRRIPGLDIWISPSSMVSPFLFYAFPPRAISKYDEENPELNFWQNGLRGVVSMLRTRGMRVSPLIDIAISIAGVPDPYTTQNPAQKALSFGLGAVVPADLIPPWIWNAIDAGVVGKFNKYASSNKTSRPQVEWFDYLVESKIMEDYLGKIRSASSEDAKVRIAIQARNLIQARENSPEYQRYVEEMRNTQYYKSVIGYATASYLSWYTEGATEMYALNKQINLLRDSINNELPAAIFMPNETPEDIEQAYNDLRWTSGEGKLWNVRNTASWVVDDDTGMQLNGDARRDDMSKDFTIETQTEELYAGIGAINEFYDKQRRELDLGRDYSDPVYKNLRLAQSKAILDLQANYPDVDEQWNFWYVGYKPQTKIEEKFTKNIVYLLNSLQPVWDREGGEKYPDYLIRKKAWEDNIPNTVQELAPVFMLQLTSEPNTAWANQDVLGVINDIIPNINIDVVNKVNMSSDSAPEALARAYDALHMDFYYDEVFGKQGAEEDQAIREFRKKHPTPTDDQLIGWVKQNYGETWTEKELKEAMTRPTGEERTILNAEDAVLRGKSDDEVLRGEIYNIYGTIPSSRKSEFYDTFQLLGGNTDDLTTFFNTGVANPFKAGEEQKLSNLRDAMAMTASKMKIQPPSDEELALQVQAQRLNDELKKMLTMELGEGYEKVVQERGRLDSVALKRKWDRENPVEKKIVNDYYDLRDTFAKQNPIWAYYYTTNTLSHPPTATSDGRKTTAEKLAELRARG